MQALVRDLLAFSHVGRAEFEPSPCEGDELVEAALANLRAVLDEAHAEVQRTPLPRLHCEPTQVVQVFQNLIENAVKSAATRTRSCA